MAATTRERDGHGVRWSSGDSIQVQHRGSAITLAQLTGDEVGELIPPPAGQDRSSANFETRQVQVSGETRPRLKICDLIATLSCVKLRTGAR